MVVFSLIDFVSYKVGAAEFRRGDGLSVGDVNGGCSQWRLLMTVSVSDRTGVKREMLGTGARSTGRGGGSDDDDDDDGDGVGVGVVDM